MKRNVCLLLAMIVALGCLSGCGGKAVEAESGDVEYREFTDDCGRTVQLPVEVTKIAVSGPLTQAYVFPLCPELFAGVSSAFAEDEAIYFPEEFRNLPELGQLYGGKGTMDLEALLAADPDVVIDVGEAKGSIGDDLDALTEQSGIPFVHIDATVATADEAYIRLGELTGCTEKAQELADYCSRTYKAMEDLMARVDADGARKKIVYCLGDKGLNVLAEGSFHAETINMVGENVAVLSEVVSTGLGNEVDMEQLILWEPEIIIFAYDSIYYDIPGNETWQQLEPIKQGEYFKTPYAPYGWLASPPAVQRYLGMIWLADLLYPEYVEFDLQEEVTEYYDIFYRHELTDEGYARITAGALRE